jgi:chitodextrinase
MLRSLRALIPLLVVLLLAVGASSASAVIVHLRNGKALSFQPVRGSRSTSGAAPSSHVFDEAFKNLDYNGGPVMPSNTNYVIYWEPEGRPKSPPEYQSGVNQYFEDLAHDSNGHENVDSVATQYNDAAGEFASYNSHFAGGLVDTETLPANGCTKAPICLTTEQLEKVLKNFVEKEKLPTDLAHEYFLLTSPGVEDCFEASGQVCSGGTTASERYCAYHANIPLPGGKAIIWANDPYVTGLVGCDEPENHPNAKPSDGVILGGLTHEHNESITDPEPNNAWTDFATGFETGFEIGDKCRVLEAAKEFGTPLGEVEVEEEGKKHKAKYNQIINGHKYWYQQEWSNQGHTCLQRLTFKGAEPTATFIAQVGATNQEILFNAGGSKAPGGVRWYSWQFNDFFQLGQLFPDEPEEEPGPTIGRFFFEEHAFNVALTVYGEDGTSIGAARKIKVGGPGPAAGFSTTPGSPTAAEAVSFDGSESTDPEGIEAYSWNFGDGSEGTGQKPLHTYALGGAYKVTLTVTGKDGLSKIASKELSVGAASSSGAVSGSTAGGASPASVPVVAIPPSSNFTGLRATLNAKTGVITFTASVADPGTFSWLLTFHNGKFGVFAASTSKCKRGFVRLGGRCRPAKIVFAKGSKLVVAPGTVSFTVKPSASALKALKNALKQRKGLPVTATFTFHSSRGGIAVTHTQAMTVKLKKT